MSKKTRQERRFLRRLKRRDEAAFTELVEQHKTMVFAVTYGMLRDHEDAEDAAQEIFVAVFKGLGAFREDSSLRTWIYRIALNHTRNRLRARARRAWGAHDSVDERPWLQEQRAGEEPPSLQHDPVLTMERRETADQIQRGLDALPELARNMIVLRDIEGRTYNEISELLGVSSGTVKSRIFRARAALRKEIEENDVR